MLFAESATNQRKATIPFKAASSRLRTQLRLRALIKIYYFFSFRHTTICPNKAGATNKGPIRA